MEDKELKEKQKLLEEEIKKEKNNLSTDRLDMSYGEIMNMYENEDIIINPEFQRLFRWSNHQMTRFVESLLIGIPTPPIFVAEDENGRWELVDGLQRISTILSFFGVLKEEHNKNNWKLGEGSILKNFKGMSCDDLPILFKRNIKRTYCRVEILKWDSNIDLRYELFNRLNTGGSPLTSQEIRNCIFRGTSDKFNKYLDEIANDEKFKNLVKVGEKREKEAYLQELVLRFTSLYCSENNIAGKNLEEHMTNFMKNAVNGNFDYQVKNIINRTINLLSDFGPGIFRFNNNKFSTSLADAIFINVMKNIDFYENNRKYLKEKINKLKQDKEFNKYVGEASSTSNRVRKKLERSEQIFKVI